MTNAFKTMAAVRIALVAVRKLETTIVVLSVPETRLLIPMAGLAELVRVTISLQLPVLLVAQTRVLEGLAEATVALARLVRMEIKLAGPLVVLLEII
jgi:hypothetical protein